MKENKKLVELINLLKSSDKAVWKRIAFFLEKPVRKRPEVNVSKLNKFANDKEILVVPGKVLGDGIIDKKINVAAFSFSDSAKKKIEEQGGKALSIKDIFDKQEKNLRIII